MFRRFRSRIGRSVLIYRLRRLLLRPSMRLALRFAVVPMVLAGGTAALAVNGHLDRLSEATRTATTWLRMQQGMMVVGVEIVSNLKELEGNVADVTGLSFPISPLDVDVAAIRNRIEALPAVSVARLHVRRDAILQINVEARPPALLWRISDGVFLIDADGRVIGKTDHRSDRPDLKLLAGEGADAAAPEALLILDAIESISDHVRGMIRIGQRRWDIVLDGNRRILLPAENAVAAAQRANAMCVSESLLARTLEVLDMRNPERPTIRMQTSALVKLGLVVDDNNE